MLFFSFLWDRKTAFEMKRIYYSEQQHRTESKQIRARSLWIFGCSNRTSIWKIAFFYWFVFVDYVSICLRFHPQIIRCVRSLICVAKRTEINWMIHFIWLQYGLSGHYHWKYFSKFFFFEDMQHQWQNCIPCPFQKLWQCFKGYANGNKLDLGY